MSSSSNSGGEGGAAAGLAPGFRFHPTDEELVGYYLKRKIAGRPFRVDAISEIELYKAEPWDLPGKSRIRSRDAEWYFFCALDRKYANRSRTNRATAAGYWKTTGKDRPVCRSSGGAAATSSPIGMKKTLVFHLGRAPSGRRTNWVMHEYRLIEPQDGFVVCRIFQKRGPGPQNGAQYGAPLAEVDDWDECETPVVKEELVDGDLNADLDVEEQKPVLFMGQELSNGVEGSFYGDAGDQWRSNVILKDRFLELDDFAASPRDTIHKQEDLNSVADYLANDEDNGNDDDGDDDDDDNDDGDDDQKHDENGRFKEFSETGQDADDGLVYFDAASQYPDGDHGLSLPGMNSFLDATMGGEVGADLIDEIMAYFDATENLNPTDLDVDAQPSSSSSSSPSSSSHHPCPAPTVNASPQSSADKAGCSSSSPMSLPIAETCHADLHSSESWEKALSKHLFTMLDAISPPPAFVEGQPAKGSQAIQHHSTDRPSSSIRITAGIIQIHGAIVPGNGKNSSLQKNIGISFVFSCTEDSDLMGSGSLPKTAGGFLLRNSFHLLFLSVLLLTASFKIGLHIYSR